jgi:hypothetical protein
VYPRWLNLTAMALVVWGIVSIIYVAYVTIAV